MTARSTSADKTIWKAPEHVAVAVVISQEQYERYEAVVAAARGAHHMSHLGDPHPWGAPHMFRARPTFVMPHCPTCAALAALDAQINNTTHADKVPGPVPPFFCFGCDQPWDNAWPVSTACPTCRGTEPISRGTGQVDEAASNKLDNINLCPNCSEKDANIAELIETLQRTEAAKRPHCAVCAPRTYDEADDMCPNCVTPWKCNGPHEPAGSTK